MQLGVIGLGRMGANIARRLHRAGHNCVIYNRTPKPVEELAAEGMTPAADVEGLVRKLDPPRAIWLMLPAGAVTEGMVTSVSGLLGAGDGLIDGGNTFYKDDIRRANALQTKNIAYVDVGTSGGVWGLERGYCMMIGGPKAAVDRLDPIFRSLAPGPGSIARTPGRAGRDPRAEHGYIHAGPAGAWHFVKMIHNGIEYGLMQAYAEGFGILRGKADAQLPENERFTLDLADIAEVWRRGSVISSWLLDLTAMALAEDPALTRFTGDVEDSGEGRWTLEAAIEEAAPANVLAASLFERFRSRQEQNFGDKLLSAMRFKFGGHVERPAANPPIK
jgi:6-phosphogluconate dehydrogenase